MKRLQKCNAIAIAIVTAAIGGMPLALAQEKADLKVGNIVPYSGPAAVVGAVLVCPLPFAVAVPQAVKKIVDMRR